MLKLHFISTNLLNQVSILKWLIHLLFSLTYKVNMIKDVTSSWEKKKPSDPNLGLKETTNQGPLGNKQEFYEHIIKQSLNSVKQSQRAAGQKRQGKSPPIKAI